MFRHFLSQMQPSSRRHSVCFDPINTNKNGIVLDYSKAAGIAHIKTLLKDCDVLVTNVRLDSLRRAGLHYDQLHHEFPRLIYASLTAWGSHGPDYNLAGYDIGAFYMASGMGGMSCVHEGNYSSFTTSFGDVTTAAALASAVGAALSHRLRTNMGQLVSTSLLKMGCWVMSPDLVKAKLKDDVEKPPKYSAIASTSPLREAYVCKDKVMVQLMADSWPIQNGNGNSNTQPSFESLRDQISRLNSSELPVPYVEVCTPPDIHSRVFANENHRNANVWISCPEGTKDVPRMHRMPVDMSLFGDAHGPHTRAPLLGEHNQVVLKNGWSPRPVKDEFKYGSEVGVKSYSGLVVWELADCSENIVPQICGTELMHFGATVLHSRSAPVLELPQLCRGKAQLTAAQESQPDYGKCNVLLTNLPSIEIEELHRRFPHLIIADLTAFGPGTKSVTRTSLGPFTSSSGMCFLHGCGSDHSKLPCFPKYMGDFITAQHLVMGVTFALYHFQRTGKGQIVSVNFLRSGMYGLASVVTPMNVLSGYLNKPYPASELHNRFMVPSANTFKTKDGWWITLLGADLKRHLPRSIKALGLTKSYYVQLALRAVTGLVKYKTLLERVGFVMEMLNRDFAAQMATKTWAEWRPIFGEHDVWACQCNMPDETRSYDQAIEIGIFRNKGEISFPVTMYGYDDHGEPK